VKLNNSDTQHQLAKKVRAIAFYLPQYHPIPENDEWWGKGFTEWTNVTKAKPAFPGHYQPHLPADLGFYDLRLPEVRDAQANLAREYGIYGFCYYHYWFHGKRMLERPFNEVLDSGKPDFPFCLCWANENWTRRWDALENEMLIEQKYSEEDDRQHIQWLSKAFQDQRYIRVNDKPIFLVYRTWSLPDPLKTTSIWREEAQRLGIGEIFLCAVESHSLSKYDDPTTIGFDASVEFQPNTSFLGHLTSYKIKYKIRQYINLLIWHRKPHNIYSYDWFIKHSHKKQSVPYKRFRCVTPSWDNTARRKEGAMILHNSAPHLYEQWLKSVIGELNPANPSENIVFINAWNEWAEGNHLEPCHKWGKSYLEATRRALE